jgi:predicted nuclease of restriction endonuclease-like (RecB) superfamily
MTRGVEMKAISSQEYEDLVKAVTGLLAAARRQAARSVNAILTATYWEIGRRIVEFEQGGRKRASYGEELLERLSRDLTKRFGRGFGVSHVKTMRQFYLMYADPLNRQSTIGRSGADEKRQSVIGESKPVAATRPAPSLTTISNALPLSWTHYVRLLRTRDDHARAFYEIEALRGGWSVRQLDRQIDSQFYERTALSRNKAALLRKGGVPRRGDAMTPEEEIKDPYVLEFLGLKDEYSETDLEDGLIRHLESFLLELGGDFTFVARQKRLRVGNEWYRVDLIFYHRRLRCLVLIDLKIGRFTHADAGQMHLYLNYAREHWTRGDESPPVGLILCAEKDTAVARYALDGLPNKVVAAQYRTALPDERLIAAELERTRRALDQGRAIRLLRKGLDQ